MKCLRIDNYLIALIGFVAIAFFLRVLGNDFGLPELLHPDEPFEINRALRLAAGSFDWRRAGKGGLYYLLFIQMGFSFVYLYLRGCVSSPQDFAEWFVRNEHLFYLSGRWTCAILSTLSVIVVYLIGKRWAGKQTGLIAAFFMAISPLAIKDAHYSTVDDLLVLMILCSWYFILGAMNSDRNRSWFAASIFTGLALITKLSAAVMVLPLLCAVLFYSARVKRDLLWLVMAVLFVFLIVVAIGEPGYFRGLGERFTGILKLLLPQKTVLNSSVGSLETSLQAQEGLNTFVYYFNGLLNSSGWPLLVGSVVGLAGLLFRRDRLGLLFSAFLIPYILLICMTQSNLVYSRYLLPVLPLIYLLFAYWVVSVAKAATGFWNPRFVLLGLSVVAGSFLIVQTWQVFLYFERPNTRILAQQWIHQNIPSSETIFMEGGREHRSQFMVPLYNKIENLEEMISEIRLRDPGKAKYWILKKKALETLDNPRFDLQMVMRHDAWPAFSSLESKNIDYFLVDQSQFKCRNTRGLGTALKSRVDFYCDLIKRDTVQMVYQINSSDKNWGPGIEIYKIL